MSNMVELFENNFPLVRVNEQAEERMRECLGHPQAASLLHCLKTLQNISTNYKAEADIYNDFAPQSFYFSIGVDRDGEYRRMLNGGIIFHGSHDGGGDGGAPTYSVCLTSVSGWTIHT